MDYEKFMQQAILLAQKYRFTTKPNPVVGALILDKNEVICQGAHEQYGGAHAEVNCLNQLKKLNITNTENLTLICTLEPCNHFGKTPPCTDAIIASGIKRVVIGSDDPNPKVSGTGIKKMVENGIEVIEDVLRQETINLNKFFFFKHKTKRPFITIKLASSKDGKSHNNEGSSTWITSEASRNDVQIVRAEHDAILTGGNTVRDDNPRMNARVNFPVNQPKKILLTAQKNWDKNLNFFQDADVEILNLSDLKKVIDYISQTEINSILVEAGPKLVNSFIKNELCDQLIIYESNKELGDAGVPWFDSPNLIDRYGFKVKSNYTIGPDTKMVFEK